MGLSSSKDSFEPNEITSVELFNQLQNIRVWTVLLDTRSETEYNNSQIDGAHNSFQNIIHEIEENHRVECHLVIYDHQTMDINKQSELLTKCNSILKFDNLKSISLLLNGFQKFKHDWPFMCTDYPTFKEKGRLYPSKISYQNDTFKQCLFISSHALASDAEVLKNLNITHVVNVTLDDGNADTTKTSEGVPIQFYRVPIIDQVSAPLIDYLDGVVNFMEEAGSEARILVHCKHGQSRSAAVLCAFMMKTRNWSLQECLSILVKCRPAVRPNSGFQKQLQEWTHKLTTDDPATMTPPAIDSGEGITGGVDGGSDHDGGDGSSSGVARIGDLHNIQSKTCPEEDIEMMKNRLQSANQTNSVVLVLPGSFNPIHKGHIQCLEIAKKYLEDQGMLVIGGFIQPSSDYHVKRKLGLKDAMLLQERIHLSLLAIKEHQTTLQDSSSSSSWLSVWCSGDANGIFAAEKCAKYLTEKLELREPVIPYAVCGGDFADKMGWGEYKLSCPMIAIAREGTETPKPPLKNGWHLVLEPISNTSSSAVRNALLVDDREELEKMLNTSVLNYIYANKE